MAVSERIDGRQSADQQREELRFCGEYAGFDPQERAHKLGQVALIAIHMWAKSQEVANDARLVMVELLVNTFQHGSGPAEMAVANVKPGDGLEHLEIMVANAAEGTSSRARENAPHMPNIDNESSESGRGIRIINALTGGNWRQEVEPLPDRNGYVVRVTANVPNALMHPLPTDDPSGSVGEAA